MSPITTHVLDTALGKPAAALDVQLAVLDADGEYKPLARRATNADGRVLDLLTAGALSRGTYRLTFETGAYFAASQRASFYPRVEIVFQVSAPDEHHHVPLLLSPHGYTTYRGS
jgi:5-hydroxyisourate hydrolase